MKAMHLIIAMLVMMSLASCSADGNDLSLIHIYGISFFSQHTAFFCLLIYQLAVIVKSIKCCLLYTSGYD